MPYFASNRYMNIKYFSIVFFCLFSASLLGQSKGEGKRAFKGVDTSGQDSIVKKNLKE